MKTIYSLKEFLQEVTDLAALVNEQYACVQVHVGSQSKMQFKCYINKYDWQIGDTMEESLQKLRNQVFPSKKEMDVLLDTEISETINAEV